MNDEHESFSNDLEKRTFDFAVEVIALLKGMSYARENDVIRYQLAKSGTSVGANYEESQGSYSRGEFASKIGICLKEVRESNYWLRLIKATKLLSNKKLDELVQESKELKNIFGSILKKVKDK